MGYESKVYVCHKIDTGWDFNYFETIAAVDMSKMGNNNGWRELFNAPIGEEDHWFGMDFGDYVHEDCYGDIPKYAPIENVVSWLEKEMTQSDYRRLAVLYGLLKGFHKEFWGELVVVHYGH